MRKYSWLILCLALAVLLASAFAFTRADNQTEPAFGYTLDFKKPPSSNCLKMEKYSPEKASQIELKMLNQSNTWVTGHTYWSMKQTPRCMFTSSARIWTSGQ